MPVCVNAALMNDLAHLKASAVSCTLSVFSSVSYFLLVLKRLFNSMQALTDFFFFFKYPVGVIPA